MAFRLVASRPLQRGRRTPTGHRRARRGNRIRRPRRDGHHRAQRPIDAAEIGGIVGEWLTHTPTMSVLERSRFDADSLD